MSKENIPVTINGLTMNAEPTVTSVGRAEAILRGEQGVRPTDFIDELPKKTLEEISLRCQRMFSYAELGGGTYTPEELQEAWEIFSKVQSRLNS
jgi:hypothetical protein